MNVRGNPRFTKGNQFARLARGKSKRPQLAHLLDRFGPDVVEIIAARLASADPAVKWETCRELLPYLFRKKAPEPPQPAESAQPVSLADYLAARNGNGHSYQEPDEQ